MRLRAALPMLGVGRRRRRNRPRREDRFAAPSLQELLTDLDPGWLDWAGGLRGVGGERGR